MGGGLLDRRFWIAALAGVGALGGGFGLALKSGALGDRGRAVELRAGGGDQDRDRDGERDGVRDGERDRERERDEDRDEAREREPARETPEMLDPDTSAAYVLERMRIAEAETARWSDRMPDPSIFRLAARGESWVNVGPSDTLRLPPSSLEKVDSGRVSGIAVDPRDPNIVYISTAGGGVWKAWDFESSAPNPTWHPITDHLPNLAIGAIELAPADPDTLFVGFGDPYDVGGNAVVKSTDGGGTWSRPVVLSGVYPPQAGALSVMAL